MKTKAQIRAMQRFLKKNPTYMRDKQREFRKKRKLEIEQMKAKLEQLEKENSKK